MEDPYLGRFKMTATLRHSGCKSKHHFAKHEPKSEYLFNQRLRDTSLVQVLSRPRPDPKSLNYSLSNPEIIHVLMGLARA